MSKNQKVQMSKVFLFDAFGTLFNLDIPETEINDLANGHGSTLLSIWRRKQLEYTWLKSMMDDYIPFHEVTKSALQFAMDSVGATDERLFEILMPIYEKPVCFPTVKPLLENLKSRGISTAILSNGTMPMLQAGVNNTGLNQLLDRILSVDTIKVYKPSPKVYQMALTNFKVTKQEVIFISGNQWDIAGASSFGLPTIWVNRKNGVPERLGHNGDAFVKSLAELME